MKKTRIKKHFTLLIVLCMLCAMLTGCSGSSEGSSRTGPDLQSGASLELSPSQPGEIPSVKIMVDLFRSRAGTNGIMNLLYAIPGYGEEFTAITESSPFDFGERDAYMTRIKTEIMAGKGPDVFICENPSVGDYGQGLFPFPQKAMKNHLLLPLDGYIEKAEFMEWDKLMPKIMEIGRSDEGQHILPMTFNFGVTAYNKEKFTLEQELPVTWDEALACSDPMVRYAACSGNYRDIFGEIYDLQKDEMTVTEEEIALCMQQAWDLDQDAKNGAFPEFTVLNEEAGFYVMNMDPGTSANIELASYLLKTDFNLGSRDEYWLVPKYNTQGGITANVEAFAAVNRNTRYPDESFRVLDKLLSADAQRSGFYENLVGMPVHTEVGFDGRSGPGWSMNEWNADQYKSLLGQINTVRYTTPVEQEFFEIYPDYFNNGGEWKDIVHRHYMTMQMMLAES